MRRVYFKHAHERQAYRAWTCGILVLGGDLDEAVDKGLVLMHNPSFMRCLDVRSFQCLIPSCCISLNILTLYYAAQFLFRCPPLGLFAQFHYCGLLQT